MRLRFAARKILRGSLGQGVSGTARRFFFGGGSASPTLLPRSECPPGRSDPIPDAPADDAIHYVLGSRLYPPFASGTEQILLGMGCFWCSENVFMRVKGVHSTHVGYAQGVTQNPTYAEVCTGATNHNEVVRVVWDPSKVSLETLLSLFYEKHDPTTLYRQGNDRGTQYRSGVYYYDPKHVDVIKKVQGTYQEAIGDAGQIVTEVEPAKTFFYAEEMHQQYDAKPGNRDYCGLRPLGIPFPKGD